MTDYEPTSKEVFYQTLKNPLIWVSAVFIILNVYLIITSSGGMLWVINLVAIGCFAISIYYSYKSSRPWLKVKYYDKEIERLHREIIEDPNMKR